MEGGGGCWGWVLGVGWGVGVLSIFIPALSSPLCPHQWLRQSQEEREGKSTCKREDERQRETSEEEGAFQERRSSLQAPPASLLETTTLSFMSRDWQNRWFALPSSRVSPSSDLRNSVPSFRRGRYKSLVFSVWMRFIC